MATSNGIAMPAPARSICNRKTEVYSRVCGYHRPVSNWNEGKREEFKERRKFDLAKAINKIGAVSKPAVPPIQALSNLLNADMEARNVA